MTDRLDNVLHALRDFVRERDWEQFHDPKNLAMAVVSEAGELAAEYRWLRSDEADDWSVASDNNTRIAAEAADVGIALLLFCDRTGIDLIDAIRSPVASPGDHAPLRGVRLRRTPDAGCEESRPRPAP